MTFTEQLRQSQQERNTLLCIGLDTDPSKLPPLLTGGRMGVVAFNRRIIEATADLVCAYKLNLAFYEASGREGWQDLRSTLTAIPPGVLTIGDGKRGDIGNTSIYYARALFDDLGFGACTASPYMGFDSVSPFLERPDRGVFLLAVTSNPGARDFQYLRVRGRPLYERVVAAVKRWNERGNCGLVVGATRPRELKAVRAIVPDMPVLIPGIGAQGGDLRPAVRYGCSSGGTLAIINSSRSILYASSGVDFADAARAAAVALRDQINSMREKFFRP
jgi:orotidine-5'-phosphate decarboxylase